MFVVLDQGFFLKKKKREKLMNNVTWRDPAPSVFGASAIRQVTLVKGGLKFCLFSNFSGFRLLVENGKPVRQVGALDNVW